MIKRLTKLILFTFGITSLTLNVCAQVGNVSLLQSPQSPNTAALGKFVEIPVGHYSGIPNIGVPIYDLNVKNLSLPISLSYHASGLKVREIPGWVGTGWSVVNAGGMITRIVRGHPDDHDPYTGGYDADDYYNNQARTRIGTSFPNWSTEFNSSERFNMALSSLNVDAPIKNNNTWAGRIDTEIDLFYFNFGGNQGQFTFTNDGVPLMLSGNDLKIEYTNRRFKVIDQQGIEYYFDAVETSLDKTSNLDYYSGGGRLYVSSWYVSKIVIPYANQTISFSYNSYLNSNLYHTDINSAGLWVRHELVKYEDNSYPWNVGCAGYDSQFANETPHYFSTALFLDEITWDGKKIKFYGGLTRSDLYKYKLDSIRITDGSKLIKRAKFNYSYFNPTSVYRTHKRLKLDEVQVDDQFYKFNYYESFHGLSVPNINNKGIDIWGYYNAEEENIQMGNDTNPFSNYQYGPNYKLYVNQSYNSPIPNSTPLNPDIKYARLGSLSSITYPTGGKTVFEYEGNDFSKFPFSTDPDSLEKDYYTQLKMDSVYTKYCRAVYGFQGTPEPSGIRNFVIHYSQQVSVQGNLGMSPGTTFQQYNDYILNYYPYTNTRLEKYNDQTGLFEMVVEYEVSPADSIGYPQDQYQYNQLKNSAWKTFSHTRFLSEGRYRIVCDANAPGVSSTMKIGAKFTYKKNATTYNAGGLRIKKMKFISNSVPDTSFTKTYTYKDGNNSSGVLESPFANLRWSYYYGAVTSGQQQLCGFIDLSTTPLIPLGNSQGGIIGYAKVEEQRDDNSKTVYYFTNGAANNGELADEFMESYSIPTRTRVLVDNSWKRGLSKQIDYINNANQLIKQNFLKYSFVENITSNKSISLILDDVKLYQYNQYAADPYFSIRYNRHLLRTQDSVVFYSPNGYSNEVVNYYYKPNLEPHAYPTSISFRNSIGETTITNFKYAMDFNVGAAPSNTTAKSIKILQDRHVTFQPIEQHIQKKDANGSNLRTISSQYVSFKQNIPFPDILHKLAIDVPITNFSPLNISSGSSAIDSRYLQSVQFVKYDTFGNVVEQQPAKGLKETLIWGYNHQHLVAKVIGSDYNIVIALIDTAIVNNPANDTALRTELNKIRTNFSSGSAKVITYTYAPLIGVTSITDPKGATVFYEYDAYRRLKVVKDQNNNIVQQTIYNYKQ